MEQTKGHLDSLEYCPYENAGLSVPFIVDGADAPSHQDAQLIELQSGPVILSGRRSHKVPTKPLKLQADSKPFSSHTATVLQQAHSEASSFPWGGIP